MNHRQVPLSSKRLARAMRRAMTPAETRLWLHLRSRAMDGIRFRRQAIFVRALWCARRGRGESRQPKQRLPLPPGFSDSLHQIAKSHHRTRTRQRQIRQLFFSSLLVSDRTACGFSRIAAGGRALAEVASSRRTGQRSEVAMQLRRSALTRADAGIFPDIDRPVLRVVIDLFQFRIREFEFLHGIQRVVQLLYITCSD